MKTDWILLRTQFTKKRHRRQTSGHMHIAGSYRIRSKIKRYLKFEKDLSPTLENMPLHSVQVIRTYAIFHLQESLTVKRRKTYILTILKLLPYQRSTQYIIPINLQKSHDCFLIITAVPQDTIVSGYEYFGLGPES